MLTRRARDLAGVDVIRLHDRQVISFLYVGLGRGVYRRGVTLAGRWREVLGVYRDNAELEAEFGVLDDDADLRMLAARAFDRAWPGWVLVRVCLPEAGDGFDVEDVFVLLERNELIDVQSLPAYEKTES